MDEISRTSLITGRLKEARRSNSHNPISGVNVCVKFLSQSADAPLPALVIPV